MFSFPKFSRVNPFVSGILVLLSALGVFGTEGYAQQADAPVLTRPLAGSLAVTDDQNVAHSDAQDDSRRSLDDEEVVQQALRNQREFGNRQTLDNPQNVDGDLRAQDVATPRDGDLTGDGRITDGRRDARLPDDFDILPLAPSRSLRQAQRRLQGQHFAFDLYGHDYEPLGIRVGSFLVRPELNTELLLTDNVFLTDRDRSSDEALQLRGRINVVSNWSRHEVELDASGLTSSYKQFSSENDTAYELRARGRVDVTRRTSLDAEAFSVFAQESRGSVEFGGTAEGRPNQRSDGVAVGGRHRFNRLELQLRGAFTDNKFDDIDRDYVERSVTLRAGYDLRGGLTLLTDATWTSRDYDLPADLGGINRDSKGFEVRGGIRFDNGSKLRGTVLAGYREQTPEDAQLGKVSGFVVDAEVDWQISALTDLRLEANSQIDGTTFGLASGVFDRELRARLTHAFRRNLRVGVGVEANWRDYQGIDLDERELAGIVEGDWLLNRFLSLNARYEYRDFSSSDAARGYSENRARVGVKLQR